MTSPYNPLLPVLIVSIKRSKQCQQMLASGFMNAKVAASCSNPLAQIVAFFVLLARYLVLPFNSSNHMTIKR